MQEIKIYVSAAEVVGAVRDSVNAKNMQAPALVRGVETALRLRLFSENNSRTPYPIENLANITSWQFVMDRDYNNETNYILQAVNEDITVSTVVENINGSDCSFTEIYIPIRDMNTIELDEWLKKDKNKSGLTGELVGYSSDGRAIFVLQIEKFSIRNRLTSAGEPTAIDEDYLNASQVRALIAGDFQNPLEYQFSEDGVNDWHTVQTTADHYLRQRIANLNSEWSSAILLAPGQQGDKGDKGDKGDRGEAFKVDATGLLADREAYDTAALGFSYLATDNGCIYIKNSAASGDWSDAIPFKGEKGDKGDPGSPGAPGTNGTDGRTPQRGVDYWTAADVAMIENYINRQIGPLADLLDEINGEVI